MHRNLKLGLIGAAFIALVIGHQNCGPQTQYASVDGSDPISVGIPTSGDNKGIAVADSQYDQVAFYESGNPRNRTLTLERSTGKISVDGSNPQNATVCLSSTALLKLKSILDGADICPEITPPPQAICTMIYQYPTATLKSSVSGQSLTLGESKSGCHHGPDLCGSRSNDLKDFVVAFDLAADTEPCH